MEKPAGPEPAASPPPVAGAPDATGATAGAGVEGDDTPAVSSKLFRCACVQRLLPLAYREELYHVLRLTGPLLISRILNFLLSFVNTIFCGHIGNAELAGYALFSATMNVTTAATGFGLAVACDTLISQTFGSKNMYRVGVILQRSMLILLLFCLPCWGLLINSQSLLLLLQQEWEVARIAQLYMIAFLPAVPAMFLHQLQVAYLQNQGIILPQMYTAAAANIINLGCNYLLIIVLKMGVIGSAIANSFGWIILCLLLYGYIRWKKLHKQTWAGWSSECLQDWGSYMQLAIPSTLMVCFEWWIWEVGSFLAGILGEVDLAAQHVLLELGAITYMIPLGVHAAACVRVGNALGAGDTPRAILTCRVTLALSAVLAVFQGVIIAASKSVIGYIFTSDENIVEIVSYNLNLYPILQFFDALLCVSSGIMVGAGMQKIAALSNLVSYYCVGLPIGIALMFAANLRIFGLWLGIFLCVIFQTSFFILIIFKLNWKKVTAEAQVRAGKTMIVTSKRPVSQLVTKLPDVSDCPNTAQLEGDGFPAGYSAVSTQDGDLKPRPKMEGSSSKGPSETLGETEGGKNTPGIKPNAKLSLTQLILRRGLAVLTSVLVLAVGVTVHFVFPPPEASAQSRSNFTTDWANNSTPTPTVYLELTPPP